MELTQTHFEHIAHLFPKQRGNVSLSHLTVLRMLEAQSDSRSPGEKRVTRHKDVPCWPVRRCPMRRVAW